MKPFKIIIEAKAQVMFDPQDSSDYENMASLLHELEDLLSAHGEILILNTTMEIKKEGCLSG